MSDRLHLRWLAPTLIVVLALFACTPLAQRYFFASSDGLFHLYRLMEYDSLLKQHVLFPRWAPDFFFGLGMPLFNYCPVLTYQLADVFHFFGTGYLDSARLLAVGAMMGSGIGAYLYARTVLSRTAAVLSAVAYMYVPYHLVNLYYRGDLAEYLAYTWFPFILWAVARLVATRRFVYLFAGAAFYSALILTHNISALIFSGFLALYAIAVIVRQHLFSQPAAENRREGALVSDLARLALMALAAWAITAFFWLPALAERSLADFNRLLLHYNYRDNFPTIRELFSTDLLHRYGVVFQTAEVYGYRLGLLQTGFLLAGLAVLIWRFRHLGRTLRVQVAVELVVAAIAVFCIFPVSVGLWDKLPLLALTLFPWRFLAFVGLPSALLAGFLVDAVPGRWRALIVALLIPVVIISTTAKNTPILYPVGDHDISPRGSLEFELYYGAIGTGAASEYLPNWISDRPSTSAVALAKLLNEPVPPGRASTGLTVTQESKNGTRAEYRVNAERDGTFVANVLYFPGWTGQIDGRPVAVGPDDGSGLIKVSVPAGEHAISLRFEETPLRLAGDVGSGIALFVLLAVLGWKLSRRTEPRAAGAGRVRRLAAAQAGPHQALLAAGLIVLLLLIWVGVREMYVARLGSVSGTGFLALVNMQDEVLVEGYDLSGVVGTATSAMEVPAGRSVLVTVHWRPIGSNGSSVYKPFVRLTNSHNQTWAFAESAVQHSMAEGATSVSSVIEMMVPAGTPPGIYLLEVGFQSTIDGRVLEPRAVQVVPMLPSEMGVAIGKILVARDLEGAVALKSPDTVLPDPVSFGDGLRLLDAALSDGEMLKSGRPGAPLSRMSNADRWQVVAGSVVHIDLHWQAANKPEDDLTISVHLVGGDGLLWSVRDSMPADGLYPTYLWSANEVVHDQLNLTVPPEIPPGRYDLRIEVMSRTGPLSIIDQHRTPVGPSLRLAGFEVVPASFPAKPTDVKMQHRTALPLGDSLSIVGYDLGRPELLPGEQLRVGVLWQARMAPNQDLAVRLQVLGKDGKPWASLDRALTEGYATSSWRAGEMIREQYNLIMGAAAPEGEAVVAVTLLDRNTGEQIGGAMLGSIRILPRARSFSINPGRAVDKVFDGKMRLAGFDLASGTGHLADEVPRLSPGDMLKVTVAWQCLAEMQVNYTVFTQLLDAGGRLVAQHDAPPQGGRMPTTGWLKDEVVSDEHDIAIPANLPPGDYSIITGVYDAATEKRLPVYGGGDFVELGHVMLFKR